MAISASSGSVSAAGAEDRVAQDPAADGREHARHAHAEEVEPLADAEHRAGDGKGHRPDEFKYQLKLFHTGPPEGGMQKRRQTVSDAFSIIERKKEEKKSR